VYLLVKYHRTGFNLEFIHNRCRNAFGSFQVLVVIEVAVVVVTVLSIKPTLQAITVKFHIGLPRLKKKFLWVFEVLPSTRSE